MHFKTLIAFALSVVAFVALDAADERISIPIAPVRWQLLPEAVKSVVVGPDDRTWYQLGSEANGRSDAEIRTSLENEFRQAAPQISGASIALLEPGGRAWFYVHESRDLWGYDGRQWVERKAFAGSRFIGTCATRGQLLNNLANRVAGGRAWLRDEQGVHIYDGQEWAYTALCPPLNSERHLPRFAVSPNGKYAVAMTPRFAGRSPELTDPDLWFWQDTDPVWKKRTIVWGGGANKFGTFCITDEGKLWCIENDVLRIISLAAVHDVIDRFSELVAELDSDDAGIRQRAHEALEAVAEQIEPQLRTAKKSAASAEVRHRLEVLVERASRFKAQPVIAAGRGTVLGSCVVHTASGIFQRESGTIAICGMVSVRDAGPAKSALVMVDRANDARLIPFDASASFRSLLSGEMRGPVITPDGEALWFSGSAFPAAFARRLNLKNSDVIEQTAAANYPFVHAVDAGGGAFLTPSYLHGEPAATVSVFSPSLPDPRPMLKSTTHSVQVWECIVASDGKVWATRGDGVARFDGQSWELIHPVNRGYAFPTLAGLEGIMLCRTNNSDFALFDDNKLVAIAPLRKLIEAYPNTFAAGFPPSFAPLQRSYRIWIATDSQHNTWLLERNALAVFTGSRWITPSDTIPPNPAIRAGAGTSVVVAVGDGSKVYLSKALATIEDGKIKATEAPGEMVDIQMPFGFRDREGALWLPSYSPIKSVGDVRRRDPEAVRLAEDGPLETVAQNAWPFLVDHAGNVWLAQMGRARPRSHFWVWRQGKIMQEIVLPGVEEMRAIASDKPGSVYVANGLGLHHLVVDSPDSGGPFRLDQTYALPLNSPIFFQFTCPFSERAGLVIPTSPKDLTFVSLPD